MVRTVNDGGIQRRSRWYRRQGRTTEQAAAAIGDAVKALMAYATRVKKPVVLEALDFKKKKRATGGGAPPPGKDG
jgi:hypothetical protein